jgi:pyridinium-3,5-bisthiocarboxylic acid mononucleotide nickel chelatase
VKTIYFDCFAGASGDMLLGAMLDLGLPLEALLAELLKLELGPCEITTHKSVKCGISATQFRVKTTGAEQPGQSYSSIHGRPLSEIEKIIAHTTIPSTAKAAALKAFRRLGEVEAGIHNVPVESIHFHEVGAIDSIIDIAGFFVGLELLGVERVLSSPLPPGKGFINSAHGKMPIPAPATAKLLEGVSILDNGLQGEVLTPTGALLLSESAEAFGPMPPMAITDVGHGSGEMEQPIPNIVRAFLGESITDEATSRSAHPNTISVLETNIDDMNPEIYPHVLDGVISRGALDAFLVPTVGKKGRPAILLTLLCPTSLQDDLIAYLMRETTTLGVRYRQTSRATAERDWLEVETPWGSVRIKRARFEGVVVNLAPEFEDCRKLAKSSGAPLKEIINAATAAAKVQHGNSSSGQTP